MQSQFSLVRSPGAPRGIAVPSRGPLGHRSNLPQPLVITLAKKKGFGASNNSPEDDEKKGKRKTNVRLRKVAQSPLPGQNQEGQNTQFQAVVDLETRMQREREDADFNSRLAVLRANTKAQVESLSPGDMPDVLSQPVAAFDAPITTPSIYDNPPALAQTLSQGLKLGSGSDISDPKLKNANIGPSQVGLAVGAIIFVGVFLLSSIDLGGSSKRYKGVQPAQSPPDAVEQGLLRGRVATLEEQFSKSPGDADSLEELAVSYAKLYNFDKSRELLDILVDLRPNDGEAWRLLGETSLLSAKPGRSVQAYEKAIELGNNDLQVITGLVDACIADGKQSKAVSYLTSQLASTSSSSSSDSPSSSSDPRRAALPYDEVSLQLLLAKTYNGWRGHDKEAMSTYSEVVAKHPDDFRGYLARGVYLKENGKRTEADKMFMQAKFYAPESRQAFVQRLAADPILDLPSDD